MNIKKIIIYLFLCIVIIASLTLRQQMRREKFELDAAILVGLEYEKDKIRWEIEELTAYSKMSMDLTIIKDSILKVIDTSSLFNKPFDLNERDLLRIKLNTIDISLLIESKKGESNVSLVTRGILNYLKTTFKEPNYELSILLSRLVLNANKTLSIRVNPFLNVNWPGTKIFYKDSIIAEATPFIWQGDREGLRLELLNPVTTQIENYAN